MDSHLSPIRSGEEEAELELDQSYLASGSDEMESEMGTHPLAPVSSQRTRGSVNNGHNSYGSARRARSPPDTSNHSHVSGDPTLI
ncbi:unnamed protein product [Echinostoma caproni]|uniref:CTNNB1_binding domain-containing protein n=1 Tax=Echinostoma caproni TaxID=27848 RepID=A0A182ZZS1_9TREM|nr:unnamed protein product [Echinostoma caproni]